MPPPLDPILACMLNLRRATAAAAVDGLWFSFFSTTTTAGGAMEEEKAASPVSRHIMPHLLNIYGSCATARDFEIYAAHATFEDPLMRAHGYVYVCFLTIDPSYLFFFGKAFPSPVLRKNSVSWLHP
jgi:hypothetical protein